MSLPSLVRSGPKAPLQPGSVRLAKWLGGSILWFMQGAFSANPTSPASRGVSDPSSAVMRFQGGLETMDEAVAVEGFRQVADRPALKRSRANLLIGEGGEENERRGIALGAQIGMQVDTAHTGHLDVRNHARE